MSDYLRGARTGLKIIDNFDRNDKLRQARDLALEHRYQDSLNLLENVRLCSFSMGEYEVARVLCNQIINYPGYNNNYISKAEDLKKKLP